MKHQIKSLFLISIQYWFHLAVLAFAAVSIMVGLWFGFGRSKSPTLMNDSKSGVAVVNNDPALKLPGEEEFNSNGTLENVTSSGSHRQPLQFRAKVVEPAAVLGVLASGEQSVSERVKQLQSMRGISLSKEERESAMDFLAGKDVPEGMGKGSMHWLADELLTVLRLQEPPREELAKEFANAAFQPTTDPAVRVTALSIAGGGGGQEVKALADSLIQNPETPVILRKVAENLVSSR